MPETNLFYQQLEEQSGPDYVKVVRCKACVYGRSNGYCSRDYKWRNDPEFYCANGIRRENNV